MATNVASARPRVPLAATEPETKKKGYSSVLPHSGTAAGCPEGSTGGPGAPLLPFTPNQYLTAYGHAALHAQGAARPGADGRGGRDRRLPPQRHRRLRQVLRREDAADPHHPRAAAKEAAAARRRDHPRPRDALGRGAEAGPDPRLRGQRSPRRHRPHRRLGAWLAGPPPRRDLDLARHLRAGALRAASPCAASTTTSSRSPPAPASPPSSPPATPAPAAVAPTTRRKKRRRCRCARSACPPAPPT